MLDRGEEPVNFERIGGRRFLMTMGCAVINTALVWYGKISGEVYRDIIIATVAVYVAGNVTQKIKAPNG